jgi:hypothetical protein
MKYSWLLIFCFSLLSHVAPGQADYTISGKSIAALKAASTTVLNVPPVSLSPPLYAFTSTKPELPSLSQQFLASYNVNDLAFFCRLEVKLAKKIGLPFKFRLGEVQYTERMEGKY